jgi:dihydrolipoamide dehydrogenase
LHAVQHAADFGIQVGSVTVDFGKMKERKDGVITKIRKSLEGLIQSNRIEILHGAASFIAPFEIKVQGKDNLIVKGEKIIIASGSEPMDVAQLPCDHKKVFNSSSILELTTLPKSIAIIGGGYIGCEFASLYAELGVKVTVLEALPSLVQMQGKAVSDALTAAFKKKGIDVQTGVMVEGIDDAGAAGVSVRLKDKPALNVDIALVAIGRKVVSKDLGCEAAGVLIQERGAIGVNEKMETNVPGIYAIGDVTGILMLAHVASHQGIIAAVNATGGEAVMHYDAVPAVIFTHPEIATVGMTLEQAIEKGYSATVGKFPFQALGKAIAAMETEGFAQVVVDQKTGQILGAQVVGADAASLIAEMALAIGNELTIECIADTVHAHPTLPEAWLEAALLSQNQPIHFPPKHKA